MITLRFELSTNQQARHPAGPDSVEMYPPHLTLARPRERRPGMQHCHVVVNQEIALLPPEPQADAIVVHKLIDNVYQLFSRLIILDLDEVL
jgi:hypothetical protein